MVDLGSGGLASAGEHVDVGGESCCFGAVEVGDGVGVDSSVGAVAADDDEVVACVFDAGVGGGGEVLADVDTEHAEGGHEEQGGEQIDFQHK